MEQILKHVVELPNGVHDEGLVLSPGERIGERTHNILINPENDSFFQRIHIYESGLIMSEEIRRGMRIFRFNKPFTKNGRTVNFNF